MWLGGDDATEGDMEVVAAGDAEGNEDVKDLLGEDTEILDKGGGRKEKTGRG